MTDIEPIRDIRFEGMDISQLREWIDRIKQGAGTESMQSAVRALESCVQVVTDLDDTLRRELDKLQIAWEGSAGALAAETTRRQKAMMSEAPDPLARSASSVEGQGQGYESARHKLPNCDELRQQESENLLEWAGGGFGYESDYDAEAKRIDAQKKAAQAALAEYRDTSVDHADGHRPLPVMPAGAVQASPPSGSVPGAGIGAMPSAGDPSGSAVVGGPDPGHGTVGGGSTGRAPVPGARPGAEPGGDRPGGGRVDGGRVDGDGREEAEPDAPGAPEEPNAPEERKAPGAPEEHAAGLGSDGRAADEDGIGTGTMLGIAAGGAALLGGGAYAAKRVMDGRAGAAAPGGEAKAAKTGGAASTASGGKAAGGVLSPATKREGEPGDGEHENAYAAEETPFDDERLVAPAVLGDQSEGERSAGEASADEASAGEQSADQAGVGADESAGEAGDETEKQD